MFLTHALLLLGCTPPALELGADDQSVTMETRGSVAWVQNAEGAEMVGFELIEQDGIGLEEAAFASVSERLVQDHGDISLWYESREHAVEQGFTVHSGHDELRVTQRLHTDLLPVQIGRAVVFLPEEGANAVLGYDKLETFDATGKRLTSWMELNCEDDCTLSLLVDATGAEYPVTIDPLIWTETTSFTHVEFRSEQLGASMTHSTLGTFAGRPIGDPSGAVQFYRQTAGVWTDQQTIQSADAGLTDLFGFSVATDHFRLIVGAPGTDGTAEDEGKVYTFQFDTGTQSFLPDASHVPTLGGAEQMGFSVATRQESTTAFYAGAPGANDSQGAVYKFSEGTLSTIEIPDGEPDDELGRAVEAIPGGMAAGAPGEDGGGAIYTLSSDLLHRYQPTGMGPDAEFGSALSWCGSRLTVGAPLADLGTGQTGAVWAYDAESVLGLAMDAVAVLVPSTAVAGDNHGGSVTCMAGKVVVGATTAGGGKGQVHVFSDLGNAWSEDVVFEGATSGDRFGKSIRMSSDGLWVGAPNEGFPYGVVHLFESDNQPADFRLNDDPAGPEAVWIAGDPPVALDLPGLVLSDDEPSLWGLTVSSSEWGDVFDATDVPLNMRVRTYPRHLVVSHSAPIADYVTVMASLTFENTEPDPTPGLHQIRLAVRDLFGEYTDRVIQVLVVVRPTVDLAWGTPLLVTEGDPAADLTPGTVFIDAPNGTLQRVHLMFDGGPPDGPRDQLDATPVGAVTILPGPLGIVLEGPAPPADFEAALDSLTYQNTSEDPTFTRTVIATAEDEDGYFSDPVERIVQVTAINDPPVIQSQSASVDYLENAGPTALYQPPPLGLLVDVDDSELTELTATFTTSRPTDVLSISAPAGTSSTWVHPTLTITGSASVAAYRTALATLSFHNTSDNPSPLLRRIDVVASDPIETGLATELTISVTPENDPPIVDAVDPGPIPHACGSGNQLILPASTVSDPDSRIQRLVIDWPGSSSNPLDLDAGVLTKQIFPGSVVLEGVASSAVYQTALRTLQIDTCEVGDHVLSLQAMDRDGLWGPSDTVLIRVTEGVPVLTAAEPLLDFTEGTGPLSLDDARWALIDPDSTQMDRCTLEPFFLDPEEAIESTGGLPHTLVGDILILQGPATIPSMLAALNAVNYDHSSDDPTPGVRVVRVVCTDDAGNPSEPTLISIDVAPVNDPPSVTGILDDRILHPPLTSVALANATTSVTDPDSANLERIEITVTGLAAGDNLTATATAGVTVTWSAPVLILQLDEPVGDFETVLKTLRFRNTLPATAPGDRDLNLVATDDLGETYALSVTVHVTDETPQSYLTAGDLLITELHKRPHSAFRGEWFEIQNVSGLVVDLEGLEVSNEAGDRVAIGTHTRGTPLEYLVFSENASSANNGGVDEDASYGMAMLEDGDGELFLRNRVGTLLASMAWNHTDHSDSTGASLSLDPTYPANDPEGWCDGRSPYGDGDFGTPGGANESCSFELDFDFLWTEVASGGAFAEGTTYVGVDPDGTFHTGNGGQGSYDRFTDPTGQTILWTYVSTGITYSATRRFGEVDWCEGQMLGGPPQFSGTWAESACP